MGGHPIFTDFVMLLKGGHEMDIILLVGVFDSKVIDYQGKCNCSCGMVSEARSDGAWCIAMGLQELLELLIGQKTGLGKAVHATLDFDIYMAIVDQGMELVMVHDVIRDGAWR